MRPSFELLETYTWRSVLYYNRPTRTIIKYIKI
nr:MAG TPA: hypothetical protein [Caudoviricetes sp.]